MPQAVCLSCHQSKDLTKELPDGTRRTMYVDVEGYSRSVHGKFDCTACHNQVEDLPHPKDLPLANCAACHAQAEREYSQSIHGEDLRRALEGKTPKREIEVPRCSSCHGTHNILSVRDPRSLVFPLNLPQTCGKCHADAQLMAKYKVSGQVYAQYVDSVHGRAITEKGLVVSASCKDCHGSHKVRKHSDPKSMTYRGNIRKTCGKCHLGIKEASEKDVHGRAFSQGNFMAPTCNDCHTTHTIGPVGGKGFRLFIVFECGTCHKEALKTYEESEHGKVTALGFGVAAKCSDCHGSHRIERMDHALFTGKPLDVKICQKCHPGANANFALFMPHADPRNKKRYPLLHLTYVGMTSLLVFVFVFFGIHTALWLPRSIKARPKKGNPGPNAEAQYFWRIDGYSRVLHVMVVVSFLGLALTGLPLKFSHTSWARFLAQYTSVADYPVAGFFHRFFAFVTFLYFGLHIRYLIRHIRQYKGAKAALVLGPDSPFPRFEDVLQLRDHVRYFLGFGPRPKFDRWTYWEKFDYWAVFWGVAIIGSTGLLLWFPTFFARVLPGWTINIAVLVHSDEALLAVGFIFCIHFFNTHLRGEKFPLDRVIFTGRLSLQELKEERPAEYGRLVASGELDKRRASPPAPWMETLARGFGFTALAIGIILIVLIIASALTPR